MSGHTKSANTCYAYLPSRYRLSLSPAVNPKVLSLMLNAQLLHARLSPNHMVERRGFELSS